MGLFDFFKKKENEKNENKKVDSPSKPETTSVTNNTSKKENNTADSDALENYNAAKLKFEEGNFSECLRTLVGGFEKDVTYQPLYKLAADTLDKMGGGEERKRFDAVYGNINSAPAFHDLGVFYFEMEHYALSIVFYERTLALQPQNEEAAHDLAICYARRFQIAKAIDTLKSVNSTGFWHQLFLTKCLILSGQSGDAQVYIDALNSALDALPASSDIRFPRLKVIELQEMLNRLLQLKETQTHIRDWHFVQYGSVILDFFEDAEQYVAGGRYVASWGSNDSIKHMALRLKSFMETLQLPFNAILHLPDRNSEIIARVFAKLLGLNLSPFNPNTSSENSLIIAADSASFNGLDVLTKVQRGQIVFAMNHNWLQNAHINPDVIGFMTQMYSFPWDGGGMRIDPETKAVTRTPEDTRDAELIADEIANTVFSETTVNDDKSDQYKQHLNFYEHHKDFLKSIGQQSGTYRYNFLMESPVPGSFFNQN